MSDLAKILQNYGAEIGWDPRAEKLRRALAPFCFDGTELYGVIDHALPGLENTATAAAIKKAIRAQYSNSISIDIVIELAAETDGGLE